MGLRQVYISGALTGYDCNPFYNDIGNVLSAYGFNPFISHHCSTPVIHKAVSPKEIYKKDMYEIDSSCLFVVCLENPSLEVGAELEHANANGTPIVALYPLGTQLSEFVRGIPSICKVISYIDEVEALSTLAYIFSFISKTSLPRLPILDKEAIKLRATYHTEMKRFEAMSEFTAWVGEPSLEVGMKLERANNRNIPVSLAHPEKAMINCLTLGCPCVREHIICCKKEEVLD